MMTQRATRNKTIQLTPKDQALLIERCLRVNAPMELSMIKDRTICQDLFEVLPYLPKKSMDLMIADPPYNLDKTFHQKRFKQDSLEAYEIWLESWFSKVIPLMKPTASIYICGDWRSSCAIHRVLEKHCVVRNRITFEREKGRGAKTNWKNASEDIWFATMSERYVFHVDDVKIRRRVIAPYRHTNGVPKDWEESLRGKFRITHPSNLWTDITIPFWSMPENTEHPTQKPEKLVAKMILASSSKGDMVFDPFVGSGTTSVVAKKLGRHYLGIEHETFYCCLAEKRLIDVKKRSRIQGYEDSVFWDRNSIGDQRRFDSSKDES